MLKRKLGRSGINIAPIVFGGNVFGWTADETRSFDLLDHFFGRGFNAIDTADVYSAWGTGLHGGESEVVIGKWLARRGRRDDVVLMTKVGLWEPHKGLSASTIEAAINDSLKRLQTDYLDVYFAHTDDQTVPLDETLEAFSRVIKAGKVRAIGASNYTAQRLNEALTVSEDNDLSSYDVIQPLYNLYNRDDFETELLQVAQEHDLGVVSYFSLASGFLTGKYKSIEDVEGSARADFLKGYFDERGQRLLNEILSIAEQLATTPAAVALAWLLNQPGVTAPIVSATSISQLDELLEATALALPQAMVTRLNEIS